MKISMNRYSIGFYIMQTLIYLVLIVASGIVVCAAGDMGYKAGGIVGDIIYSIIAGMGVLYFWSEIKE